MHVIGVELGPSGEPRPAEGSAKINQIDPASDPGGRGVRSDFFLARQRMRSLEVLCENSAAIRGRATMAALYCE